MPTRPRSTAWCGCCRREKASKTLKVGEFTRARIVGRRRARPGRRSRCETRNDRTDARHLSTELIHHAYQPPAGFGAVPPGVYKASTVIFPNVAALRARNWQHKTGYTYGLHGTPTTFTLEERIATLEGGTHTARWCPAAWRRSRMVDMALLKPGDEVLLPDNAYGPGKELARTSWPTGASRTGFYDPMDAAGAGRP